MKGLTWDELSFLRTVVRHERGTETECTTFATQQQLDDWLCIVKMGNEGNSEDHTIAVLRIAHSHGLAATFEMDESGKMSPVACFSKFD